MPKISTKLASLIAKARTATEAAQRAAYQEKWRGRILLQRAAEHIAEAMPNEQERPTRLIPGDQVRARELRKGDCFRKRFGSQAYLVYQEASSPTSPGEGAHRCYGVSHKGTTTGVGANATVVVASLEELLEQRRDAAVDEGIAAAAATPEELHARRDPRKPTPGTPAALIAAVEALEGVERAVILNETRWHVLLGVQASDATSEEEVREVAKAAVPLGVTVALEWLVSADLVPGTDREKAAKGHLQQPEKDAPWPERYELVFEHTQLGAEGRAAEGYQLVAVAPGPYGKHYIMQRSMRGKR